VCVTPNPFQGPAPKYRARDAFVAAGWGRAIRHRNAAVRTFVELAKGEIATHPAGSSPGDRTRFLAGRGYFV